VSASLRDAGQSRGAQTAADAISDRVPGAWLGQDGLARFRVWAPEATEVAIVPDDGTHRPLVMHREEEGYFVLTTRQLPAGALYRYLIDGAGPWPDPCSRFQPQGPHGPSQLIAPHQFNWTDSDWPGVKLHGQVVYELHIGTFTPAGTFDAARDRLQWLRDLGITLIELMPVAEFSGRRGWGYDGVQLYAPFHHYGDHEALKRFVDAAHATGLGVILDVVYNHLGPDGNYLRSFSEHYFSTKHRTDWGEAWNFDDCNAHGARDLVIHNACYWLREFHLDGFRLDATQAIVDSSEKHVLTELTERARAAAAPRDIVVIAEDEPQRAENLRPAAGGWGIDAMWNDDFQRAAHVALTGSRDGYFHDYTGRAQEFVSAARHGFLYQGQYFHWQQQRRGRPLRNSPAAACVHFLQNHDQISNTLGSRRLHQLAHPGRHRALTALLLLGPQTPMLFMGEEFQSAGAFHYFIDHKAELTPLIWRGRREFLQQFRAYSSDAAQSAIANPADEAAFLESKLDWTEAQRNRPTVELHRDLLRLRRTDPVIAAQDGARIDGATLSEHSFVVRWFDDGHGDRLLVVNLQQEIVLDPAPEPLLAPPADAWHMMWSSEDPHYGGSGTFAPVDGEGRWRIPGNSATLMCAGGSAPE